MEVKVAALQMNSSADKRENLREARDLLEEAARGGACLAVLPECFAFIGAREEDKLGAAEDDGSGEAQDFLAETSKRLGMWIYAAGVLIRAPEPGRLRNAGLVYDAEGKRVARYDKMHLFDVGLPGRNESYSESAFVAPGREVVVIDTPAGRLGLSVCYDIRFPELYRRQVEAGAQIFALGAAFTARTGQAHWEVLLRARAIENLCYVIAAAEFGVHANGRSTHGDSMIIDHWGSVMGRLPQGRGCVIADIDLEAQAAVRDRFPALDHRVL